MRHDNLKVIRRAIVLICAFLPLLHLFGTIDTAANGVGELRKYLESRAQFDAADIAKMESGEVVAKLLPAEESHEVAFCGIVSINASPERGFEIFEDRLSRLDKKSLIAFGTFSDVPVIADLEALTLEKGDIDALKKCRIGACGLKLSAAMIERFRNEVDWEGPDYAAKATDLFRRLILEYLIDYRTRGEAALIEYNNKPQPLSLRSENNLLMEELGWVESFSPEFFRYLQGQTSAELPNIKRSFGWAKIKFGLKPVIIITEVITYSQNESDSGEAFLLSVSKQIYANHYVDSSLGLIAVVQKPRFEASDSSYLLYVNHSRSSVLRGIFGKFTRKIVQHEVLEKLKLLLQNTRTFAGRDGLREEPPPPTRLQNIKMWISGHPYLVGIVFLTVAFIIFIRLGKFAAK